MRNDDDHSPFAIVLGTAQDGGIPQAGCERACCRAVRADANLGRLVTSLAVVEPGRQKRWIIDCTPDFSRQLSRLDSEMPTDDFSRSTGILLTHAHIGHYAGLIQLGREVMSAKEVQLFVMPRMLEFLEQNAPWSQLFDDGNLVPVPLSAGQPTQLSDCLSVRPVIVPHRDEFSEAVCFHIVGPQRSLLYLPDIDDWEQLEPSIEQMVREVDVAFLDGTFFDSRELGGRDMSQIPHPRIESSLQRFASLPAVERAKIRFIHLNHTNSAALPDSAAARRVQTAGCHIADDGERHPL